MAVRTCPLIYVYCLFPKSDRTHSSVLDVILGDRSPRKEVALLNRPAGASWEMFRVLLKWINKRVLAWSPLKRVYPYKPASQPARPLQIILSSMTTDLPWTEMGWNTLADAHSAAHKYSLSVRECVCTLSVCVSTIQDLGLFDSKLSLSAIYKQLRNRPDKSFELLKVLLFCSTMFQNLKRFNLLSRKEAEATNHHIWAAGTRDSLALFALKMTETKKLCRIV